ncbi:MAG: 2-phosphosulfolactate phosphatase [Bacteroidota bacterium]
MNITISQGNHPFEIAADATVIIDVLRAGTTAHYLFKHSIKSLTLVPDQDTAFSLKDKNTLLIGEAGGIKIEGFDFGNSPYRIQEEDSALDHKKIVFLTSNGTKALLNNFHSKTVLFCGLVNVKASVAYLKQQKLQTIHLIASHPSSEDDLACADYMKALLQETPYDLKTVINRIQLSESAFKFHHQTDLFPAEDLEIACMEERRIGYVLKAQKKGDAIYLNKVLV